MHWITVLFSCYSKICFAIPTMVLSVFPPRCLPEAVSSTINPLCNSPKELQLQEKTSMSLWIVEPRLICQLGILPFETEVYTGASYHRLPFR